MIGGDAAHAALKILLCAINAAGIYAEPETEAGDAVHVLVAEVDGTRYQLSLEPELAPQQSNTLYSLWTPNRPPLPVFPPLPPAHGAYNLACHLCRAPLGDERNIVAIPLGPTTPEHRELHRLGAAYPALKLLVHEECGNGAESEPL